MGGVRGRGGVDGAFGWGSTGGHSEADLFYADLVGATTPGRWQAVRSSEADEADAGEELDVNDARRKTFRDMWDLVVKNRWSDTPALFTNEMIISICWEESTFMNIWQEGKNGARGPAKGFGQIEPSGLNLMRIKFKMAQTVPELQQQMDQDAVSVQFVGRVLHTLHDNLRAQYASLRNDDAQTKRSALQNGYAGYLTDHAQWRLDVVNGWYAAEAALLSGAGASGYPTRSAAQRALDLATPANRKMQAAPWQAFLATVCSTLPDP